MHTFPDWILNLSPPLCKTICISLHNGQHSNIHIQERWAKFDSDTGIEWDAEENQKQRHTDGQTCEAIGWGLGTKNEVSLWHGNNKTQMRTTQQEWQYSSVCNWGGVGGALQLTCYMCRCRPAGCLFLKIRYCPGYLFPKIWFITG